MDKDKYLQERLDDQIEWYDKKSKVNQKWFKLLKIMEISSAALIPFIISFITDSSIILKIIAGSLGILVVIISGIIGLYKFQENWIEYRTTCETLKHEKYLFLIKSNPYNIDNPLPLLVQRAESIISKENTYWSQYIKKEDNSNTDSTVSAA